MNINKRTLRQSVALALLALSLLVVQMGQVQVAKADVISYGSVMTGHNDGGDSGQPDSSGDDPA